MLIISMTKRIPAALSLLAANLRFSTKVLCTVAKPIPRGWIPAKQLTWVLPRTFAYSMALSTPARNSSTRSGWHAIPRSPLAQWPAGRLNNTWVRPWASSCCLISVTLKSYGKRYSTPLKPASDAALKRAKNSCSVNSIERLAAIRGMGLSFC
ncbi:hypothetical protein D3C76_1110630 [compost metagenome]